MGARTGATSSAVLAFLLASAGPARGDVDEKNASLGPVVGWFMNEESSSLFFGWEGGVGIGPQRANVGQSFRPTETFSYVTVDPWLILGGTLGLGYGAAAGISGVAGLWEGVPLLYPSKCSDRKSRDYEFLVTVSVGFRFGAGRELYLAPKIGASQPLADFCN